MQWVSYLDKRKVLQQEYSQAPILPAPHFRWVVKRPSPFPIGYGIGRLPTPHSLISNHISTQLTLIVDHVVVVFAGHRPYREMHQDITGARRVQMSRAIARVAQFHILLLFPVLYNQTDRAPLRLFFPNVTLGNGERPRPVEVVQG